MITHLELTITEDDGRTAIYSLPVTSDQLTFTTTGDRYNLLLDFSQPEPEPTVKIRPWTDSLSWRQEWDGTNG